jgi:outer membrane beta-barrel protein
MESRIRLLLLSAVALWACSGCAVWHRLHRHSSSSSANAPSSAGSSSTASGGTSSGGTSSGDDQGSSPPPVVVVPQVQRRTITVPKIKSNNVELGAYYGELSIQDFGTQPVEGLRLDYHITEDFFFEGSYGRATAGKTSFELLSGGIQLLSNAERRFTYYNLSLGYNVLPGETFIGHKLAMTSALYLIGGIGSVQFAGDQNFTVNFGAGYRILPTDWLALHLDVQDLVFRTDIFTVYRLQNNLQATLGLSVFF